MPLRFRSKKRGVPGMWDCSGMVRPDSQLATVAELTPGRLAAPDHVLGQRFCIRMDQHDQTSAI